MRNARQAITVAPARRMTEFILCLLVIFSVAIAGCSSIPSDSHPAQLKDAYKHDFLIGAAVNEAQFCESNSLEAAIVKHQFNSISPENALKWEKVHPMPHQYFFRDADCYVQFGLKNRMTVIGHNLIWHSQTPNWVFHDDDGNLVDRETLLARMREHIFTVVGRYKGKIHGWDVVNEAMDENGDLRNSPWRKIIGDDYIVKAFEFAHEADPQAELYYNDFSLENEGKRAGAVDLIKKLQAHGVKITGIGLQGHYGLDRPALPDVDQTIATFEQLGLKVMITELDINVLPSPVRNYGADVATRFRMRQGMDPYTNGLPESVQQQLAQRYSDLFAVFLKHRANITRVTFWGVTDANSWLNDWPIRGRTAYPLLFDRSGKSKPALDAIIETERKSASETKTENKSS